MIPSNLKVGDTFTDGGRKYRVDALCSMGYISHAIDMPEKVAESAHALVEETKVDIPTEEVAEPSMAKNYTKTQINRMSVTELEKVCGEVGVEVGTGTAMKKAIIAKLGL